MNFELEPFVGYPGEIGYDDGEPDDAIVFIEPGNGWAVRMSLDEGEEQAMVTGALFRFWDEEFPNPGGTEFQVEVYDASGTDGAPGEKLAGPIDATANRDGTWTQVDLFDEGIIVDDDFYVLFLQSKAGDFSPAIGIDMTSPDAERSWEYFGGSWSSTPVFFQEIT